MTHKKLGLFVLWVSNRVEIAVGRQFKEES